MQTSLFKLNRQQTKLMDLLSDGDWHHFRELNEICFRYGARIYEMRKMGYVIEIKKDGDVSFYRLGDK